jgi:hypothetical protein
MVKNDDVLKVIETAIPATVIKQVIVNTKVFEERKRALPRL